MNEHQPGPVCEDCDCPDSACDGAPCHTDQESGALMYCRKHEQTELCEVCGEPKEPNERDCYSCMDK